MPLGKRARSGPRSAPSAPRNSLALPGRDYLALCEESPGAEARQNYADAEDPEEYLAANVFWVPPEARWEMP